MKRSYIKRKTRLNPIGRIGRQWVETRHEWIKIHAGEVWSCYICGTPLTLETLTLDHVKSRGRHPELRFDMDNLKPCCMSCNMAKGSRDL